jgi:hypothetical protein
VRREREQSRASAIYATVKDAARVEAGRRAWTSQLGSTAYLHAQIAEAFEIQSPELMDSQPELIAQHNSEAGLVRKPVAFGERPVKGQLPARRRRKRPRSFKGA